MELIRPDIKYKNSYLAAIREFQLEGKKMDVDIDGPCPAMRDKGYGTKILELALPKAKQLGIDRVLLTCDETNIASRKIIEKNGGVLENKVPNSEGGPDKLRFWIAIND